MTTQQVDHTDQVRAAPGTQHDLVVQAEPFGAGQQQTQGIRGSRRVTGDPFGVPGVRLDQLLQHRDLTGLDRSQLERSLHSVPFLALSPGSVLAPSLAR